MDGQTTIKGPDFEAKLSVLDAKFIGLYSRRLFIFKPAAYDRHRIATILEQGIERLVQQVPILGGTVTNTGSYNGQKGWDRVTNGPGIELVTKEVDLDLSNLKKRRFPPSELPDDVLFSSISADIVQPPYPACKMQLNLVKDGALLAFCVAHVVGDGPAMSTILCLLAEHCRLVQETSSDLPTITPLSLDRTCYADLKSSQDNVHLEDHPAYARTAPLSKGKDPAQTNGVPAHDIAVKMYRISEQSLKDLKTAATTIRISTHDAISALIWHSTIINRIAANIIPFDSAAETTFFVPVNTRRYTGCGKHFIGNAVYHSCASLTIGMLLSSDGLAVAAAQIRNAINAVDRNSIAAFVELHKDLPNIREVGWRALAKRLTYYCVCTSFYHNEDMYTADWGGVFGGRVLCMRPSDLGFLGRTSGSHFVMPREEGRGCEVQMSVERGGVEGMEGDGVFARYFSSISKSS